MEATPSSKRLPSRHVGEPDLPDLQDSRQSAAEGNTARTPYKQEVTGSNPVPPIVPVAFGDPEVGYRHTDHVIYRLLFRLILQRLDAEDAHQLAARVLRVIDATPLVGHALRLMLRPRDRGLRVRALGLEFPSPLGVAAGMDKDASWFESLGSLGFGFVEVGTVTALPQAGNPRPRVFRLIRDAALLNSMGFPNPGAGATAERLRRGRRAGTIVGVNIGKSRVVELEDAGEDYRDTARQVGPLADFVVINVSSPNTPGLRGMQEVGALGALIDDVAGELGRLAVRVPVLIKIGPDLSDGELDDVCDLALDRGLDGIVAVNTTLVRNGIVSDPGISAKPGGISGAPLKRRALEVVKRLRARSGGRLVLISVGGIETSADAWERLMAGATLVQVYTGFVYGGPLWPARLNRGLSQLLRESGHRSLEQAIGVAGKSVTSSRESTPAAA